MDDSDDKLQLIFDRQTEFMELLRESDKMPEWPVDLRTKPGQRLIKETLFNMIEELMEASFTLKNKMHRVTDAKELDFGHYLEELGDAFAYFVEVLILSGIDPQMLYEEYVRKNEIVKARLRSGY
jgi:hypothetical protein